MPARIFKIKKSSNLLKVIKTPTKKGYFFAFSMFKKKNNNFFFVKKVGFFEKKVLCKKKTAVFFKINYNLMHYYLTCGAKPSKSVRNFFKSFF